MTQGAERPGVRTMVVAAGDAGSRLDRWFGRHFPDLGHGALRKLLRTGQVRLDGKRADAADRVATGQTVRLPPGVTHAPVVERTTAGPVRRMPTEREAREIQALVIHRDDHVIALNKPPGLAVQGGSGTDRHIDGLLDALRFEFADRPKLIHRLDKDTSGLLLVARTGAAARHLSSSFRDRDTDKLYWAVVVGRPPHARGRIDLALAKRPGADDRETMRVDEEAGQRAITDFTVADRAGTQAAFLHLWPRTGRTHQLRVHCAAIGCPILGDRKYGGEAATLSAMTDARRLHLHARRLTLPHPGGGTLDIVAEPPPHFSRTVEAFGFSTDGD